MAAVANRLGVPIGHKNGIYPTSHDNGDTLSVTGGILIMERLGAGVYNSGTADVTLKLILAADDEANPLPVVVAGGATWRNGYFNGVVVAGSTGHALATTHYLYE
ncbi:MAG: hypothetical protein GY774_00310 [Planctomycetes bacterium]|nr:hypothetical protein [Planctomycetota bacterium]